jgi:ferrous iron transport protein B
MIRKLALVGNPNIGKTSLFNRLTGMRQKVGNFAGVTIEKKSGKFYSADQEYELVDLPGTYSLSPKSKDEEIVTRQILDEALRPDAVLVVVDASNLERNLVLFSQVADLRIPTVLALNMVDVASQRGINISPELLKKWLGCPVVAINARSGMGIEELKSEIKNASIPDLQIFNPEEAFQIKRDDVQPGFHQWLAYLSYVEGNFPKFDFSNYPEKSLAQAKETVYRYKKIKEGIALHFPPNLEKKASGFLFDKWALHPVFGYLLMLGIMLLVFEAIFKFSEMPMDWIEGGFGAGISYLENMLPEGVLKRLLLEGVLAGIQGIVIFIPQIAILFFLIGLMEESGYMARVMVLTDLLMKKMGLSGKAVIPLVSGVACAVPAIMSTRSMPNTRERLIAIFVTPLMSCSARLPVFTLLIGMLVPATAFLGPLSWQGLSLFGLYLVGLLGAIVTALVMNQFMPGKGESSFVIELPPYQYPHWKNVWISVYQKSSSFVLEAGKVILAISIILWFLAGFGPGQEMENAYQQSLSQQLSAGMDRDEAEKIAISNRLEASFAGHAGKWVEPVLKPLGFDWKIGVALITSFAAREVFVGTMSVLYASGSDGETEMLKTRMLEARNPETGKPVFSGPTILSLLVFYIFAMQCMSTLAVSYRETQSWKWPLLQLIYMSGLAYVFSALVFQLAN